jgi:hypothetical protein
MHTNLATQLVLVSFGITAPACANAQSEAQIFVGIGSGAPWRVVSEDGRGEAKAIMGPTFSLGVGFANQVETGKTTWMRFDILYSKYRIALDEQDQSLCCSTHDRSIVDIHLATVRLGPEFELSQHSKLFIPLDLIWPLASRASGYHSSFIPPNQTQRNYVNEKSNFGRFNIALGTGVSFGLPISTTYLLSIGPVVSLGLFDQAATTSDVRLYNYSLFVSLRRRVDTPRFIPQD